MAVRLKVMAPTGPGDVPSVAGGKQAAASRPRAKQSGRVANEIFWCVVMLNLPANFDREVRRADASHARRGGGGGSGREPRPAGGRARSMKGADRHRVHAARSVLFRRSA